jgi:hypothetical protein
VITNLIIILEQAIRTLPENCNETRLDVYGNARQVAFRAFKEFKTPAQKRFLFMHALEEAIRSVEAENIRRAKGTVRRFG